MIFIRLALYSYIILLITIYSKYNEISKLIEFQTKVNTAKEATLRLNINQMQGSGIAIKYYDKKFILTNAHVCLMNYYSDAIKNLSLPDKEVNLTVTSETAVVGTSYKFGDVYFSVKTDICIIPYQDLFRNITFYEVKNNPFKVWHGDQIKTYTRNRSDSIYEMEGIIQNYTPEIKICMQKNKNKDCINSNIFENVIINNFKTIAGDSGSPIFDENMNLVSLVFANYKDDDNSVSMKYENRQDEEQFILEGYALAPDQLEEFLMKAHAYYE